ncbi:MAG: flagellar basal-body MS-ring/collar protein FliF [Vicinamibacterales bacterium]
MNPDQLFAQFKRLTSSLSRQQLATVVVVFLAVVGILVGAAYYINTPNYAVLFSDLDTESAGDVVKRLKAAKVEYTLDDGGRTVRVPSQRLDELRLDFSTTGMPSAGRIGFEIFDRTAFGTTEFLEHVNYRRALEGELARTIGTIAEVQNARVHIAMAEKTLFLADTQQAKASVVLKLKGRKPLAPTTVAGITNLLANSVEDLRPENVSVMDSFGRSLTQKTDDENDALGLHLDKQRQDREGADDEGRHHARTGRRRGTCARKCRGASRRRLLRGNDRAVGSDDCHSQPAEVAGDRTDAVVVARIGRCGRRRPCEHAAAGRHEHRAGVARARRPVAAHVRDIELRGEPDHAPHAHARGAGRASLGRGPRRRRSHDGAGAER